MNYTRENRFHKDYCFFLNLEDLSPLELTGVVFTIQGRGILFEFI